MYSYEDRIRAVKLYIKPGKRTGATIQQLGYPTQKALKNWHREFEQVRDLPVGYARLKPKYSDEQKKVAAQHYLDHGRCLAGTLKALGYPCRDTHAAWGDELYPETKHPVVGKAQSVPRPQALKQAAVIELCTRQTSAQSIAQRLAVSRPTLYQWKNQLLGPEAPASMKPNNDSPPDPERAELERHVQSLQRDIRKLQLEHDLLKKANELLKKAWASTCRS
ncbi:MAG: Mobile element protein [Polaromonas sp.]|nr:Mobile element protein [Polaromonas sp.]